MLIGEAATQSEDVTSLPLVLGVVALNAITLGAVYCWITGWGNGGRRMRAKPRSWVLLMIRVGYTLVPFAIAYGCATALMLALFAYEQADKIGFGLVGLVFAFPMFGAGLWAFKEYVRPSPWRKTPAWVIEFNLRGR